MRISESIVRDEHIEEDDITDTKFRINFWHLFFCNSIFLFLCYLPNLQMRFSEDTYLRICSLGSDLYFHPTLFFVFMMFLSTCVCILTQLSTKTMGKHSTMVIIWTDFSFVFGFVNVLMQEYFCYPETYLHYGIGLILLVFSLYVFNNCNFSRL